MDSTSLTCHSPLGKLAPGNAEIDKAFKDMWVEAEKNRSKWSCESHRRSLNFPCISWFDLLELLSNQIWGELRPCSISRTVKASPPSGFHTGRISKAFSSSRLHLSTVWVRMLISRRSFRTWELCTRPIIRQKAPGRPSMIIRHLWD